MEMWTLALDLPHLKLLIQTPPTASSMPSTPITVHPSTSDLLCMLVPLVPVPSSWAVSFPREFAGPMIGFVLAPRCPFQSLKNSHLQVVRLHHTSAKMEPPIVLAQQNPPPMRPPVTIALYMETWEMVWASSATNQPREFAPPVTVGSLPGHQAS